jgi:hypothetical protein
LDDERKDSRNGEYDVLVGDIWQRGLKLIHPIVSRNFSARRAESRFTSEVNFFEKVSKWANKLDEAESGFTSDHFGNTNENGRGDLPKVECNKANPV